MRYELIIYWSREDANIPFADICHLLERAGFIRRQCGGSHGFRKMSGELSF